jgi:hypothetical protein
VWYFVVAQHTNFLYVLDFSVTLLREFLVCEPDSIALAFLLRPTEGAPFQPLRKSKVRCRPRLIF